MGSKCFVPHRILFEQSALEYPLGKELWQRFEDEGKELQMIGSHNRVTGLPGATAAQKFREAKQTLVVGVRRTLTFASCRPSADYQLALSTSCPGMCEYCYLHTTLGRQPVVRLYVNLDEIFTEALRTIKERAPMVTVFEGAATSDPLPLEPYSGALAKAILFFSRQEHARFRFVTKFTCVEPLLELEHRDKTEIRFSVNREDIIHRFEHRTPPLNERLAAAARVWQAGYPLGFLIAPIFLDFGWRDTYKKMLQQVKETLPANVSPTFELVTHRFTTRGKANIEAIFTKSDLPLTEEERRFKFGQFGYGKYLYKPEAMKEAQAFFTETIGQLFPEGKLLYFV